MKAKKGHEFITLVFLDQILHKYTWVLIEGLSKHSFIHVVLAPCTSLFYIGNNVTLDKRLSLWLNKQEQQLHEMFKKNTDNFQSISYAETER